MKIKFTPVVIFLLFVFGAHAQSPISFTSADMPGIGFSETYAVDTPVTSVNYGNAGANQVYDFSNLTSTHTTSVSYVALTNPQHTNFPTANQALYSNGSYIMLDSTTSKYQAVGLSGTAYGNPVNTPLSPVQDVYHFPTQYQSTYASKWGFYQAFDGNTVNQPSVDSVREIYTDKFSILVDGWGKVITPVGSYRGLRIKRIDTMNVQIDYYLFGWHNVTSSNHVITSYSYVSKETKGTLVSFNYNDTTNAMRDAQYSLIPPAPPVAGFRYVIGSAGLVTFTDTSEGFPTRYHWSFGDGASDTSNLANPTHTYAANGTYYVCETVYNASGSNTVCDSVHITNIVVHERPVAVDDAATVHQPNYDTINVTANDHSPSNDAFCVTSVYGGQYFSVLGCNNVAFTPNAGFTGYDTCHYIVCNTGQPTLCDTAELIVDVIANAVHYPPVAVNDTVTVLQPASDLFDVTANDNSPSADAFCITTVYGSANFSVAGCGNLTFHPDSIFTGNDTAWYVVCNTNQPTLCDTASVVVTVVQNPALLPDNRFLTRLFVCGGIAALNKSTNADSIVWEFKSLSSSILDSIFVQKDSIECGFGLNGVIMEVCLTAYNRFGSVQVCDTGTAFCDNGINEVQLSGINIYPNPASSQLTIDMHNNTNPVTRNYTAIEIYNAIGQKVKTVNGNGNAGVVNISVTDFAPGIYLATIVDSNGARSTLGKFTVMQ